MTDAAAIVLSEELLRDQLAGLQSWRAMRANPAASWDDLATLIDAGGNAAGDAADAVLFWSFGPDFGDDTDDARNWPRLCLRRMESEWRRTSSTGWNIVFRVSLDAEFSVNPDHLDANGKTVVDRDAYLDAERKLEKLALDLAEALQTAGIADVQGITMSDVGSPNPQFYEYTHVMLGDFVIECHGVAGGP